MEEQHTNFCLVRNFTNAKPFVSNCFVNIVWLQRAAVAIAIDTLVHGFGEFFFICTNMAKHLFSISFANLLRNNGSYWYVLWCDVFASLFVPWWCFTISLISQQCAFSLNFTYINIIRRCWSWLSCLQTSKWIEFAGVLRLNTRYVMLDGVMCMYNSWIHRGYEVFGKLMPERLCNHRHTQRLE